ncbi:uncharacterized protein Z520_12290 [Fonsecaea multimorphosa CBS 102226]|uniref:Uncharacterized protein n=1 Tax=Fonsecaea multimorphosa CBS 102226 TaxID=1442371 RepID=A0A0D2JNF6_9EURO|nr:uncharacterized protein Z520_12290 [Fonsecaea multimorphosa CBS 102226]KIX92019.1 hypothetical protein Z520_12290 [Fonsecaea multimorphosa CBS 102226]OAL17377.1 hypothetical protein AYO22_11744 [Fonsecaea multimorphosa]
MDTSPASSDLVFEKRPLITTLAGDPSLGTDSHQRQQSPVRPQPLSVLSAALQSEEERDCQEQLDGRRVRLAMLGRELNTMLRLAIFTYRHSGAAAKVGSLLVLLPTERKARQQAEIFASLRRPDYPPLPDEPEPICTF